MACRYDDNEEEKQRLSGVLIKQREELDLVTRMLCEVLRSIPSVDRFGPEVQAWWTRHRAADEARRAHQLREAEDELRRGESIAAAARQRLEALRSGRS